MIFKTALSAWQACSELRRRRARYKDYTYGRQWDDIIIDNETGQLIKEGAVAERSGRIPITNNLIRQLVKTVVGRYRNVRRENQGKLKPELSHLYDVNRLDELDCRLLEEFLISGCAIQRITKECRREGKVETFVDNVCPADFFINSVQDPRCWDIQLIGMLHDMSMPEVIMKYAHGDRQRAAELRKIFTEATIIGTENCNIGGDTGKTDRPFFYSPTGRCRVIEVWTLESCETLRCHDTENGTYYECHVSNVEDIGKENALREEKKRSKINMKWCINTFWRCHIFSPDGKEIDNFVSPYKHGEHPFVVKLYPMIDG